MVLLLVHYIIGSKRQLHLVNKFDLDFKASYGASIHSFLFNIKLQIKSIVRNLTKLKLKIYKITSKIKN